MSDLIIIKAKIYLLTSIEGGRTTGIKSGYRPNHAFEQTTTLRKPHYYDGDIRFDSYEYILPGETKIATVRFLRNEIVERFITIGRKWFIHEGPIPVGKGEVIEILSQQ